MTLNNPKFGMWGEEETNWRIEDTEFLKHTIRTNSPAGADNTD